MRLAKTQRITLHTGIRVAAAQWHRREHRTHPSHRSHTHTRDGGTNAISDRKFTQTYCSYVAAAAGDNDRGGRVPDPEPRPHPAGGSELGPAGDRTNPDRTRRRGTTHTLHTHHTRGFVDQLIPTHLQSRSRAGSRPGARRMHMHMKWPWRMGILHAKSILWILGYPAS